MAALRALELKARTPYEGVNSLKEGGASRDLGMEPQLSLSSAVGSSQRASTDV